MLTLQQKNKRKLSRLKNEILKATAYQISDGTHDECLEALLANKKVLNVSFTHLDVEYEDEYNQHDMIKLLRVRAYILVAEFINTPNQDTYNTLLNGYFLDIIYYVSAKVKKMPIQGGFDSDIILSLLLTMTYCDTYIQSQLVETLTYYKTQIVESHDTKYFFASKTLLPLAYHFDQENNNTPWSFTLNDIVDKDKKLVNPNIMENITPLYQKALDHIYTDDLVLFQDLINELCQYRLDHSKGNYLLEFNGDLTEYFPIEILFLLKQRVSKGLSIEGISHELIDDFLPYFLNDFKLSEDNQFILKLVLDF